MATTKTTHDPSALRKLWRVATHSSGPLGWSEGGAEGVTGGVIHAPLVDPGDAKAKHYAALEAATGKALWMTRVHGQMPPRFAAAITEGAVTVQRYAPTRPKVLVVLDRATGKPLRDLRCGGSDALDESSAHVYGPYLFGAHLVCVTYGPLAPALREVNRHAAPPPRGHVTATDPATGKVVYDVELAEGMVPHTVVSDGERLFVGGRQTATGASDEHQPWQGRLLALRGADGSTAWESEPGPALNAAGSAGPGSAGPGPSGPGSSAPREGVVLADVRPQRSRVQHVAASDDAPSELVAFDAATGVVRFRRAMAGGWTSFVAGDRVVLVEPHTDSAVALDAATGAQLWSTPSPHGGSAPGNPKGTHARSFATCGGAVWLTGSKGRVIGFDLEDGRFRSSPARGFTLASDGERLFVGDAATLTAFAVEP